MVGNTTGRDDPSLGLTSIGGLLVVALSVAVSLGSYGALGAVTRIRWSIGTHYGPEFAPTLAVVTVFPVVVTVLYIGFRWFGTFLEETSEFENARLLYEFVAFATLGTVVFVQGLLVALNLYL